MTGPINPNVTADDAVPFQGSYVSGSATVGTTAAALVTVPGGYNGGVVVTNTHASNILYLGGSNVTTSNGLKVAAGASVNVPGGKGLARTLYAVASAASTTVTYLLAE
jgi:hypothetical protein